jgi:hypothetical protein
MLHIGDPQQKRIPFKIDTQVVNAEGGRVECRGNV